jgi:hypothetical protein
MKAKTSKKMGKGCMAVLLLKATTLKQTTIAKLVGLSDSRVSTLKFLSHAQGVKLPKHRKVAMAA